MKLKLHFQFITILFFFFSLFVLNSCLVVKYENKKEIKEEIDLSPKPTIVMSETMVRSDIGDMIAFIPEDWFFIDIAKKAPADVFAVAVNQEYSLSAVFSYIRSTPELKRYSENNDLLSIAKNSLNSQKKKTGGRVTLLGNFEEHEFGEMRFVSYQVTTTNGALISNVCVFKTEFNNIYRFSLVPMDVIGKPIPRQEVLDEIFRSILTTIKY